MAQLTVFSSSLDDSAVPGSSPSVPEVFKANQNLLQCVAAPLGIQAEFLKHKLLDILKPSAPGRVVLLINDVPGA